MTKTLMKTTVAAAALALTVGCASQAAKESTAEQALRKAEAAQSAANKAQNTANEALQTAREAQKTSQANSKRIERMWQSSQRK